MRRPLRPALGLIIPKRYPFGNDVGDQTAVVVWVSSIGLPVA